MNNFIFQNIFTTLSVLDCFKLYVLMMSAVALCSVLGLLSISTSITTDFETDKMDQYECGFDPFDNAPEEPFNVHYYITAVLFLIFDIEVAYIFPFVIGVNDIDTFVIFTMLSFVVILALGFLYEWKRGALVWAK